MNNIASEKRFMEGAFPHPPPVEWFESRILPTSWNLIGPLDGKRVLDYGCGSGWIGYWARKEGAIVSCTDIFHNHCEATLNFKRMESWVIPFEQEFDMVLTANVLHHGDMGTHIREIKRVLKPGGRMVSLQEPCILSTENEAEILATHCGQEIKDGIDERRPCLLVYRGQLEGNGFRARFYHASEPMWTEMKSPMVRIQTAEFFGGIAVQAEL